MTICHFQMGQIWWVFEGVTPLNPNCPQGKSGNFLSLAPPPGRSGLVTPLTSSKESSSYNIGKQKSPVPYRNCKFIRIIHSCKFLGKNNMKNNMLKNTLSRSWKLNVTFLLRLRIGRARENRFREVYLCLNKTASINHIDQNSATMDTEKSRCFYTYMVYAVSTPIWYTTRLNYASYFAGFPSLKITPLVDHYHGGSIDTFNRHNIILCAFSMGGPINNKLRKIILEIKLLQGIGNCQPSKERLLYYSDANWVEILIRK